MDGAAAHWLILARSSGSESELSAVRFSTYSFAGDIRERTLRSRHASLRRTGHRRNRSAPILNYQAPAFRPDFSGYTVTAIHAIRHGQYATRNMPQAKRCGAACDIRRTQIHSGVRIVIPSHTPPGIAESSFYTPSEKLPPAQTSTQHPTRLIYGGFGGRELTKWLIDGIPNAICRVRPAKSQHSYSAYRSCGAIYKPPGFSRAMKSALYKRDISQITVRHGANPRLFHRHASQAGSHGGQRSTG